MHAVAGADVQRARDATAKRQRREPVGGRREARHPARAGRRRRSRTCRTRGTRLRSGRCAHAARAARPPRSRARAARAPSLRRTTSARPDGRGVAGGSHRRARRRPAGARARAPRRLRPRSRPRRAGPRSPLRRSRSSRSASPIAAAASSSGAGSHIEPHPAGSHRYGGGREAPECRNEGDAARRVGLGGDGRLRRARGRARPQRALLRSGAAGGQLEPDECRRVRRDRLDDPADVRARERRIWLPLAVGMAFYSSASSSAPH